MKIAIIALVLSLAALGLGSFAIARTLNESHPAPPERQWSEVGCDNARIDVREGTKTSAGGVLWRMCAGSACVVKGVCDCAPYTDMLQAIAENCP